MQCIERVSRPELRKSQPAYSADRLHDLSLSGDNTEYSELVILAQRPTLRLLNPITSYNGTDKLPPILREHWFRADELQMLGQAVSHSLPSNTAGSGDRS